MQNPFNARAPHFDAAAINATIQRAFASAGLDTRAGPMHGVADTIQRALATAGRAGMAGAVQRGPGGDTVDVVARVVSIDDGHAHGDGAGNGGAAAAPGGAASAGPAQRPGSFETHMFTNHAGSLAYKVYLPAEPAAQPAAPRAMVVMLHGCTQCADDFAAGTQMNRLADAHGLLVVYPEQAAQSNPSKCWNWFQPQDQLRGAGEPSLIAGIVGAVAQQHGADPRRIFVAGLSAGAAMALTLGETYPDVFAGVGAHSGLPYGSAQDMPSALAAMKGGRSRMAGLQRMPGASGAPRKKTMQAVPVIVFHGDRDHTVQQTNAALIVQCAVEAHAAQAAHAAEAAQTAQAAQTPQTAQTAQTAHRGGAALHITTHTGVAPGGRRFSRAVHADAAGHARIEQWTLQGAGHAWSGGHASGSFTDATGPDASAEMLRFFLALPRAGAA